MNELYCIPERTLRNYIRKALRYDLLCMEGNGDFSHPRLREFVDKVTGTSGKYEFDTVEEAFDIMEENTMIGYQTLSNYLLRNDNRYE